MIGAYLMSTLVIVIALSAYIYFSIQERKAKKHNNDMR